MTETKTPLYEGKAKRLFKGDEPGTIIQYFKDDATAFNAQKKNVIIGKGILNNLISAHLFRLWAKWVFPITLSPAPRRVNSW